MSLCVESFLNLIQLERPLSASACLLRNMVLCLMLPDGYFLPKPLALLLGHTASVQCQRVRVIQTGGEATRCSFFYPDGPVI